MAVNWPGDPLPSWVTSLRPQQIQAVNEIMDAYRRGVDVVVLDAPVGAGKTLIAELTRRSLGVRSSTYVAHSISLQSQFVADFPYAKVLKGRTNYPTLLRKDLTAADCGGSKCGWCEPRGECPYLYARKAAVTADVAVLNTSYMLSYKKPTFMRGLVVVDECVPGSTKISTPTGLRRIDSLKIGDEIWGEADGRVVRSTVTATSEKPRQRPFVRVGETLMTDNHPVWVDGKYVQAGEIEGLERIAMIPSNHGSPQTSPEGMRVLHRTLSTKKSEDEILFSVMPVQEQLDEQSSSHGRRHGQDVGDQATQWSHGGPESVAVESEQPNLRSCSEGQVRSNQSTQGLGSSQWGEWEIHTGTSANVASGAGTALETGICGHHEDPRSSSRLQDRHCASRIDGCDRSGRGVASQSHEEGGGCSQGSLVDGTWVEGSSLSKQDSYEGSAGGTGNDLVYNLKTTSHNYFANGVLVHNCDTLESVLKNHYEFFVGAKKLRQLGIKAPVKGARTPTVIRWLREDLEPAAVAEAVRLEEFYNELGADMAGQEEGLRKKMDAARNLCERVELLAGQLEAGQVPWVREYGAAGDYVMRPVEVSSQGAEVLWERGKEKRTKWLAMSGTVIDAQEWVASTGVEAAGLTWDLVTVPMLWRKENRPIVTRTWGDMSNKGSEEGKQRAIRKCAEICKYHVDRGDNVLVHSVSYGLMNQVCAELQNYGVNSIKYAKASERDRALAKFKRQGGVIVAPSLDRGVDLPDDLCRVQIVMKMPFLHLGDRQVSERLNMPDGARWYAVAVARTLVQMTGRGVRHQDDRCVTYILDRCFDKFYSKWSRLLPRWWRDSIVGELPEDW